MLTGSVSGGPESSSGATFPAATFAAVLALRESSGKSFGCGTGVVRRTVNSPAAYLTLDGVGETATVTQGDFLYFKSDGLMLLRLTQDDGAGSTTVQVVPVHGLVVLEFPSSRALELLEVQGTGQIEYLVTGQT
jgi:hypothetical protein